MKSSLRFLSLIFFFLCDFPLILSLSHFLLACQLILDAFPKKKKKTHDLRCSPQSQVFPFSSLSLLLNLWKGVFIFNRWYFNQKKKNFNYFLCWIIVRWSYCWEKKGIWANFFELNTSGWEKKGRNGHLLHSHFSLAFSLQIEETVFLWVKNA